MYRLPRPVVALAATLAAATSYLGFGHFSHATAEEPADMLPMAKPDKNGIDDLAMREDVYERTKALVDRRQFKELDELGTELRESRAISPSGVPLLFLYYVGIDHALLTARKIGECRIPNAGALDEWKRVSPRSHALPIVKAAQLIDVAWCHRGTGYAPTVSDQGWRGFHENIAAASAVMSENAALVADDPQRFEILTNIYLGEGRTPTEFTALLEQATKADAYYYPLYWGSFTYYQPQWFGSAADIDAAARFAAADTSAADGMGGYARFYWHAAQTNCRCWRDAIDWPTMKRAMRDLAVRYPDPWNYANFARISCEMDDGKHAREYLARMGDYDASRAWSDGAKGLERCRAMAGV